MRGCTILKYYSYYDSPVGRLTIAATEKGVCNIYLTGEKANVIRENEIIIQTINELREYFNGTRKEFKIPLDIKGTEFQKRVWKELLEVPYGTTATYGEIATRIGNPNASRAVGNANNKNPVPIIIPCHRIIGAGNKLVGYAGGLTMKKKLLELEKLT